MTTFQKSKKLFRDAAKVIPGGVNSPVRAFKAVGSNPIFIDKAKGAYLYDADGKPTLPSFFIDEVTRCFEQTALSRKTRELTEFLPGPDEWESATDVARGIAHLTAQGGKPAAFAKKLLSKWDVPEAFMQAITRGPGGGPVKLKDPRVLATLQKLAGPFSASRLENFIKCPFKHFAASLLHLKEPLEGREHAIMGDLLHATLREYFAENLSERERKSGEYRKDSLRMKLVLDKIFLRRFDESPLRLEPLYRQAAWREALLRMLSRYVELECDSPSGLVPTHFEYAFGEATENPLRIDDESGAILLRGSVDRVDVDAAGRAIVIDYKKSSRDLKSKVKKGEEIQLPIYLLAVRDLLGLEPAGFEHHILKTGSRETPDPALSDDDLKQLLTDVTEKIRESVRSIRMGEVRVQPKDCQYCEFDSVCRVEVKKSHDF